MSKKLELKNSVHTMRLLSMICACLLIKFLMLKNADANLKNTCGFLLDKRSCHDEDFHLQFIRTTFPLFEYLIKTEIICQSKLT